MKFDKYVNSKDIYIKNKKKKKKSSTTATTTTKEFKMTHFALNHAEKKILNSQRPSRPAVQETALK